VDVRALQLSIWKQLNQSARNNRNESKFPAFLAAKNQPNASVNAAADAVVEPPKSFQQTISGL
jgi:hypothetical protein